MTEICEGQIENRKQIQGGVYRLAPASKNWGYVENKEKYIFSGGGVPSSKGRMGGTPQKISKKC